jgi:hypothetical protein
MDAPCEKAPQGLVVDHLRAFGLFAAAPANWRLTFGGGRGGAEVWWRWRTRCVGTWGRLGGRLGVGLLVFGGFGGGVTGGVVVLVGRAVREAVGGVGRAH